MIGIYIIKNTVTNKVYIGQSKNITHRFNIHKRRLQNNSHENIYLQRAWNKYGENSFTFSILEKCKQSKLTEREQYWIDYYGGLNCSVNYNLRDAGSIGRMSEDAIEKMRAAKIGTKRPDWVKQKLSESRKGHIGYMLGKEQSKETRQKISNSLKGKKKTPEHIVNARDARIKNGTTKHSVETKQKISKTLTGTKQSVETRQKRSESIRNWWKERKQYDCASNT